MIKKYKKFREDAILESVINESYIYYAPNFKDVINKMKGNEIADDISNLERTDIKPDVTFVDLDKDGYLSFIKMKNAVQLVNKNYTMHNKDIVLDYMNNGSDEILNYFYDLYINNSEYDPGIFTTSRNEIKIGKFINKLFPNKYTAAQIEDFINSFKANIKKLELTFELVEGEDIGKWYYYKNYKEVKGTLGNSCMSKKKYIFDIYQNNPDVCKLLILKQDDKLLGRALVWKLNSFKIHNEKTTLESVEWFMDRQYTINDSYVIRFRKYAQEKNWIYKSRNNHYSFKYIKLTDDAELTADMTVKVKSADYGSYPYLDTFRRYDPETGILYNDNDENYQGQFLLDDTSGSRTEIVSNDTFWSDWYDDYIPEEEAVYSVPLGSYIYADSSVNVVIGSRDNIGYWPHNHDDIVKLYNGDACHIDDTVYSAIYDDPIFDGNALKAITLINENGDVEDFIDENYVDCNESDHIKFNELIHIYWYETVHANFGNWNDYDCIMKELMIQNYKSEWIPKILVINIYRVDNQLDAFNKTKFIKDIPKYLCIIDAMALDCKIDTDDSKVIDKFEYTKSISKIEDKILKGLKNNEGDKDESNPTYEEIEKRIEEIEKKYYR